MMPDAGGDITPRPDPTVATTAALLREIAHLKELHQYDIDAMRELYEMRFKLIEDRRQELKEDNQTAIDTSLTTAREALANLAETYQTGHGALAGVVDEVKSRLTVVESKALGSKETSTTTIALVGVGMTFLYLAVNVIVALVFHH